METSATLSLKRKIEDSQRETQSKKQKTEQPDYNISLLFQLLLHFLDFETFYSCIYVSKNWNDHYNTYNELIWQQVSKNELKLHSFFHNEVVDFNPQMQIKEDMTWFDFFKTRIFPLLIDLQRFKKIVTSHEIEWKPEMEKHLRLTCFLLPVEASQTSPYLIPIQLKSPRSKFGGLPDFPEGETPPSSSHFVGQLNMADFKDKLTTFGLFPQTGILYFWINRNIVIYQDVKGKKLYRPDTETVSGFKIYSIYECLTFDQRSWIGNNNWEIVEEFKENRRLKFGEYLCVGGQAWDLQANYSASDKEMLLLQYTVDEGFWWACFFMIDHENLKQQKWDTVVCGDSLMR